MPVACYGNLRIDAPGVPANLVARPGGIPFGPPLAATFARHPITIDVLNPGFVNGYSHKPVLAFASGGFVLVNRKRDFIDAFGEAGEAVSYGDGEELGAKVDRFLGNPKYRRETGDAIRETIGARFQLTDVLRRSLLAACRSGQASRGKPAPPAEARETIFTINLLPEIRCRPEWSGAGVEHVPRGARISTGPDAWGYAAEIPIPRAARRLSEPHLRIGILVEAGRIGISAVRDRTGALLAEQTVSATAEPVAVTIELPHEGASTVILRNTVDGPSRALVVEAGLCDRRD